MNEAEEQIGKIAEKATRLRGVMERVVGGIDATHSNPEMRSIEEGLKRIILEDVGVLIVGSNKQEGISNLWDLVQPHLPNKTLEEQRIYLDTQERLMKPMRGLPSKILEETGLNSPDLPVRGIVEMLRNNLTQQQNQLLPIVVGRSV